MREHRIRSVWRSCAGVVVMMGASFPAMGADYYVATTGSDSSEGTQAAPLRTITRAYTKVVAGDRILVQPGTYTDHQSGWALVLDKKGTAGAPITLKSVQKGMAIIDASQSDRDNAVSFEGDYHVLDGFKITGARYTAVFINGSNNKFVGNEIYSNGRVYSSGHTGNQGFYESTSGYANYFGQNYIHDNGGGYGKYDHGLYLCGDNGTVVNNIVVGQPGMGLQIAGYNTVSGLKVYNNVFARHGLNGIVLWENVANIEIYNNIVAWNRADGIGAYDAHGQGVLVSNNVSYGNATNLNLTGGGSDVSYTLGTTVQADPRFAGTTDYHLQSSSPAIDAGKTLAGISQDYWGDARPQSGAFDIGVHESGSTAVSTSGSGSTSTSATTTTSGSTSVSGSSSASLIQNGGFESGRTGWGDYGSSTVVSGSNMAFEGSYAIAVGKGDGGVYQELFGVTAGAYTLTFAGVVGDSSDKGYVGLEFYNSSSSLIGNTQLKYNSTSWQNLSLPVQVPSGTTRARVYVWKDAGPNYIAADKVSLTRN
jgi:hypothetical protein